MCADNHNNNGGILTSVQHVWRNADLERSEQCLLFGGANKSGNFTFYIILYDRQDYR